MAYTSQKIEVRRHRSKRTRRGWQRMGQRAPGQAREAIERLLEPAGVRFDGSNPWDIEVRDERLYPRIMTGASMAVGEAYMDAWWSCQRIDEMICRVLRSKAHPRRLGWKDYKALLAAALFNLQHPRRATQIGERHYDLGNDLFRAMLDERMIYSGAYWKGADTLDAAQEQKLELICRKLLLKRGQRLLDIGCGWGGLLRYAAEQYGVDCVGLTVSREQVAYAKKSMPDHLPVEVRLEDYRAHRGSYDRIVSVGMIEHVGPKNYRTFFDVCRNLLKEDDGVMVLQTIGANVTTNMGDPWIARYIFPNSKLPSAAQLTRSLEKRFVIEDWQNLGPDYDRTLLAWHRNFTNAWPKLREHYGERFRRMWEYYLLSCAGAFRAREIQLWQLVLSPRGTVGVRYDAPRAPFLSVS